MPKGDLGDIYAKGVKWAFRLLVLAVVTLGVAVASMLLSSCSRGA